MKRYLLNEASKSLRLTKGHENPVCHPVCHPELVSGSHWKEILKQVQNDREAGFSDERGTALVIAMIFLGLLTTIGIYALLNTSTELIGSASYKSNKEAFYAAEGAIEYVKGDGYYFTTKGTMNLPDNTHPNIAARSLAAEYTDATGTIKYVTSGNPPPGYGFSAKDTMSSYFVIEAIGTSRAGVQNTQEEGVAKILPKG